MKINAGEGTCVSASYISGTKHTHCFRINCNKTLFRTTLVAYIIMMFHVQNH